MAIGTSDGEYFDDEFSHLTDKLPIINQPPKDKEAELRANDKGEVHDYDQVYKSWEHFKDMLPSQKQEFEDNWGEVHQLKDGGVGVKFIKPKPITPSPLVG